MKAYRDPIISRTKDIYVFISNIVSVETHQVVRQEEEPADRCIRWVADNQPETWDREDEANQRQDDRILPKGILGRDCHPPTNQGTHHPSDH